MKDEQERTSLFGALWRIALVSSCLWGAFFGAWVWHSRQQDRRKNDPTFIVKRVAARPLTQDRLPIGVLAELLQFDTASHISIFSVQLKEAQDTLLSCPAISRAKIWRLLPGTLGIEYALRSPIAKISGLKNVGIDDRGTVFFLFPYYAPKKLPSLVLPIGNVTTLADVQRRVRRLKETAIAIKLLELTAPISAQHGMTVDLVDVSSFHQQSAFRREVVFAFTPLLSKDERLYVRVGSKNLLSKLEMLPAIFRTLVRGAFRSGIIDLRYENFAILSGEIAQKS